MTPCLRLIKSQFERNLKFICSKTTSDFICPMVKANGYGMGDVQVVELILEFGISRVGVARVSEGLNLRRFLPQGKFDILVFHPVLESDLSFYRDASLTPVVSSIEEIKIIKSDKVLSKRGVHLKFDLGMNRFGFRPEEANRISLELQESNVHIQGVAGHFPSGDDFSNKEGSSLDQLNRLKDLKASYFNKAEHLHIPNSSAILKSNFDVGLRPGISMYLGDPSNIERDLGTSISLAVPLLLKKKVRRGEGVSYGATWRADRDTEIGILPIGYADGLRRGLSNRIQVRIKDKCFPLVGAICMDYSMVDIGLDNGLCIGEEFEFFGPDFSEVKRWSDLLGTIPYEILTGLGSRVVRRVV